MRIRIIRKPTVASIDLVQLDRFEPGQIYEVGELLGAVMIAEGWARLAQGEPAVPVGFREPMKIVAPRAVAADRPRRGKPKAP